MVPPPRAGSFSPNPAQTLQTGTGHSPHPSHAGLLSAGASPSTSSPTGTNSLTKIVVAQVYLLLSTIKEDKDRDKWEVQVDQLRKLIDDHGMEVFAKYFTRLVAGNAPQIFPGLNRPVANPGNYHILVAEMRKIAHVADQASKIAESIESGTEDIFRDFDLSTFMEHFKLDALEKTILALAFKTATRPDLKTKADAILSTNFQSFIDIISRPELDTHSDLAPPFFAFIIDRILQYHPPSFNASSRRDLETHVSRRYISNDQAPPSEVLAAMDVARVLADRPTNALARYIQKTGADFTRNEEACVSHLQNRPSNLQLGPDQVAAALTYALISQTPPHDASVLTAALQRVLPRTFDWNEVVLSFDQPSARISSSQFLRLYQALLPIAQDQKHNFDIQKLWGGSWSEPEAQLSYVSAYASLTPDELDATTIPGLQRSISMQDYADSPPNVQERAAVAVRHPLVSVAALSSIFNVALNSHHASQTVEAKRLFQEVVVPNLDIFLVSAFDVPRESWAPMAVDTLNSLFENFFYKRSSEHDFVFDTLWRKDRDWIIQHLIDAHAFKPTDLTLVFEHAVKHGWLDDLVYLPNGFGLDLAAYAHAEGQLDLANWARFHADRNVEMARTLLQFLMIKTNQEIEFQRPTDGQPPVKKSASLQVRTVSALLQILEDFLPKAPVQDLILVQRHCITAYPRLINYGEGYDAIIDAAGKDGNALPQAAVFKMEEHYKKMYGDELQVRTIVDILDRYKRSQEPLDQDAFACMIHGLFDEYHHYVDYPLEALATTAVLFGGIISHKLISDLPLKIGLGMILEAVRDHLPDAPMYKFGLQALMQLLARFREWPGFCKQLLQIPGLQGTEAFKKAEEVVRDHEDEMARSRNGSGTPHGLNFSGEVFANGSPEEPALTERQAPPFTAINVDPVPPGVDFEEPGEEEQGKIQFVLNNITEGTIQSMQNELRDTLERKHQQWFASHLVEERAKMQPNYHKVYLDLVKLFEDKSLWSEVLRETYVSVARMLNSEVTLQNSTERTQLKNLGGWLGLLTLARNKPIKHKNIAFKQLLIEAHETKRLIVAIPFVCKVLLQGASSAVFRSPNPWLMDIIRLLIELYHHAELKLNLKFEIEVLCKGLSIDHRTIQPTGEILNRPLAEATAEILAQDQLDMFENLSLNGIGSVVGPNLAQTMEPSIPDLGPLISIPPTNEMVVSAARLHEIVQSALTRALTDIIQPVVDRSITIAAISTGQMVRKDFVSEPDENRVRASAINMVKATAGSLALVTSKEPLRANLTNYMRILANDLPSGLPEGTVIMCVNLNLDLACSVIEKQAEERAVPEIEELLEEDFAVRRRHRIQHPNEPFYAGTVNRWAMTIPHPFKLSPSMHGLNPEQMAIYDDFARQPRNVGVSTASHAPSTSDATRSLANEVLQEPYNTVPSLPTPAETPSAQHLGSQLQSYPPVHAATTSTSMPSSRPAAGFQMEFHSLGERVGKLLQELIRVAGEAREEHFAGLPRPHPVLDVVDALVQLIIKTSQNSEEFSIYTAEQISALIFQQVEDNLALESLVHVLETVRKISGPALNIRVRAVFAQQHGPNFLSLPLLAALVRTDLLDWGNIDVAMSKAIESRKEGSLDFLDHMLDLTLVNTRPVVLFTDFPRTFEASWNWITNNPGSPAAQRLRSKLTGQISQQGLYADDGDDLSLRREQMEYVFEEWVHLSSNVKVSAKANDLFIEQLESRQIISGREDLLLFIRVATELCVDRFDHIMHSGTTSDAYLMTDALARAISLFICKLDEGTTSRSSLFDSILALIALIFNQYYMQRGEHMNQKVFFRLMSMLLYELNSNYSQVADEDHQSMLQKLAFRLETLGPLRYPGFIFAWLSLLQHRAFLPVLLRMPENAGWGPFIKLLSHLLHSLGDQLKPITVSPVTKDIYRATLKLLVVLQHDFPEFVAAHHIRLCSMIPPHCAQLLNAVLAATPQQSSGKLPDPMHPGLKVDLMREMKAQPLVLDEASAILRDCGLLELIDQSLQNGPAEETVAQIAHAMTHSVPKETSYGFVTVDANTQVIGAVVVYIGQQVSEARAEAPSSPAITGTEPGVSMLSLLVHEVPPGARYYLLSSMINQLRFPNGHTDYFSRVLLHIFGHDLNDPEESEIRQEMTRVFLERLVGFWPQPWGLMFTVLELIKNEKYRFFDLPFIKSTPEVAERFAAILQRN